MSALDFEHDAQRTGKKRMKNMYSAWNKLSFFLVPRSSSCCFVREPSVEITDNEAPASISPSKRRVVLLHKGKQV